jgi:hypothetical protein
LNALLVAGVSAAQETVCPVSSAPNGLSRPRR